MGDNSHRLSFMFSSPGNMALAYATKKASACGSDKVYTLHLLHGVYAEKEGLGSRVLDTLGFDHAELDDAMNSCGCGWDYIQRYRV